MPVPMMLIESETMKKMLNLYSLTKEPRARFGNIGCVLAARYSESAQEIKDMEVRPDDVWIVTPPKCGTTWTQEMVWLLMNDLDYEGAKKLPLVKRSPFLEYTRFATEESALRIMEGNDSVHYVNSLSSPRCIKSHLPKDLLPDQLWTKKPKIIYVARDPKDAAVSYFHHEKLLGGFSGKKDFYFRCFYEDLTEHSPFWEHVLDFWQMRSERNVLFNTYEEMKEDLPKVIRRTAFFLGKSVSTEDITKLAAHLDIKQMKRNPAVNLESKIKRSFESDNEGFIRKGAVGEGLREMSVEMAQLFDERTERVFGPQVGGSPWGQ